MFVLRVICLCLCVYLLCYTFVHHHYVEAYNEIETKNELEQKIKAFFEPTELHGKYIMADNNVVEYKRVLKGMSREASDMAQSLTSDANNRLTETGANAQHIQQTSKKISIQTQKTELGEVPE